MEPRGESCRQPDIADRTRVERVGATPALLSRQRRVDSVGQHAGRSAARGFQYESHSTVAQHFDGGQSTIFAPKLRGRTRGGDAG